MRFFALLFVAAFVAYICWQAIGAPACQFVIDDVVAAVVCEMPAAWRIK